MTKIFSLAQFKGGSGKTTIAYSISTWAANHGKKVLAIDTDPQSNLSMTFGLLENEEAQKRENSVYEIFVGGNPKIFTVPDNEYLHLNGNLDLIVSSPAVGSLDNLLAPDVNRYKKFGIWVYQNRDKISEYDYVMIDNQPGLDVVTKNMMATSDYIIAPMYGHLFGRTARQTLIGQLESFDNETFDPTTGHFFDAQVLFIGNNYQPTKRTGKQLLEYLDDMVEHGDKVVAKIEKNILFEEATENNTPAHELALANMSQIAKTAILQKDNESIFYALYKGMLEDKTYDEIISQNRNLIISVDEHGEEVAVKISDGNKSAIKLLAMIDREFSKIIEATE